MPELMSARDRLLSLLGTAPPVRAISESMVFGDQRKYITARFDLDEFPSLELSMLTDVQFGHICCNVKKFLEYRDWILAAPNRFCFWGGDMIDAATKVSPGDPHDNRWTPNEQVLRFIEIALPLRHRILGYVGGNHERRFALTGGAEQLIANLMGIPYSAGKQIIDIYYGEHKPFQVALWHGTGGARTKGAKAQMLHRFMQQGSNTRLYLLGHLHDVVLLFDWKQRAQGGKIKLEKVAGVMSSSFLEHWGSYQELQGLPPTDTMMARCVLDPDGHWEITLR